MTASTTGALMACPAPGALLPGAISWPQADHSASKAIQIKAIETGLDVMRLSINFF
jgi:hypothetical protein